MAYDPGAIQATLAAAVGDEPGLIAELRLAFADGARAAMHAIEAADDERAWRAALGRLKGLAASFGAVRLMVLANEAADRGPADRSGLRKLRRAVDQL